MRLDVEIDRSLEGFVAELLAFGRYASGADVARDGLMRDREERMAEVDRAIERGLADAEAGRVKTVDEAWTILTARFGTPPRP